MVDRLNSNKFVAFAESADKDELMAGLLVLEIEHVAMFLYMARLDGELEEENIRKNLRTIRDRSLHYLIKVCKEMIGKNYMELSNFPEIKGEEQNTGSVVPI